MSEIQKLAQNICHCEEMYKASKVKTDALEGSNQELQAKIVQLEKNSKADNAAINNLKTEKSSVEQEKSSLQVPVLKFIL